MALNNAYKICRVLHHEQQHQQDENKSYRLKQLFMNDAVEPEELTYFFYSRLLSLLFFLQKIADNKYEM